MSHFSVSGSVLARAKPESGTKFVRSLGGGFNSLVFVATGSRVLRDGGLAGLGVVALRSTDLFVAERGGGGRLEPVATRVADFAVAEAGNLETSPLLVDGG